MNKKTIWSKTIHDPYNKNKAFHHRPPTKEELKIGLEYFKEKKERMKKLKVIP